MARATEGLAQRLHGSSWPIGVAVAIRLAVWLAMPASRFASDEDSYYRVGMALLNQGQHDLFWPPVTGWLVAAAGWMLGAADPARLRLVWIACDIGCVLAVRTLAGRVAPFVAKGDERRASRFVTLTTLGYALYLPAIAFAQFTTSETPALLLLLLVLVLVTRPGAGVVSFGVAGLVTGTLLLTRPNLLPLLLAWPAALALGTQRTDRFRLGAILVVTASLVVGSIVVRNRLATGELTIARNSAYNLYIGNRDFYAEDLNLFSPRATAAQIEFRRQYWSGDLEYPSESPAELQRAALEWVMAHPGMFVRRAIGRLARVFAPRTDVLELAGGERRAGIFSPVSLGLLGVANLQWLVVLFGGIAGLVVLRHYAPAFALLSIFTILGSLVLCLIAISKPRYSFVFAPLLLMGASVLCVVPRSEWRFSRMERLVIGLLFGFLLWGWVAWLVFSLSSRLALAGGP